MRRRPLSEAEGCCSPVGVPDEHHLAASVAAVDHCYQGSMLLLQEVEAFMLDPVQVRADDDRDPTLLAPFGLLGPPFGIQGPFPLLQAGSHLGAPWDRASHGQLLVRPVAGAVKADGLRLDPARIEAVLGFQGGA